MICCVKKTSWSPSNVSCFPLDWGTCNCCTGVGTIGLWLTVQIGQRTLHTAWFRSTNLSRWRVYIGVKSTADETFGGIRQTTVKPQWANRRWNGAEAQCRCVHYSYIKWRFVVWKLMHHDNFQSAERGCGVLEYLCVYHVDRIVVQRSSAVFAQLLEPHIPRSRLGSALFTFDPIINQPLRRNRSVYILLTNSNMADRNYVKQYGDIVVGLDVSGSRCMIPFDPLYSIVKDGW